MKSIGSIIQQRKTFKRVSVASKDGRNPSLNNNPIGNHLTVPKK